MRLADLQRALRAADPAAVLVSPRILERIIQERSGLTTLYWSVPHSRCYVVDRQTLFRHAEQADLDLEPDQLLPATVILLARPPAEELGTLERELVLLKYWRRLFHASVHFALEQRQGDQALTPAVVRARIAEIGPSEFEEIRTILVQDGYLLPGADDRAVYVEFAAVFLEMSYFAANLLPNFFPGVRDFRRIDKMLAGDVDAEALFHRTRLVDAPDPVMPTDTRGDESHEEYWDLVRSAERAALAGNTVRAALLRSRAARIAPASLTGDTRAEAEADVRRLVVRLAAALELSEGETADWYRDLALLLDKGDQNERSAEALLLDDLQKVCIDHERDIFTLDMVEWLLSAGKRPIKRPLPSLRLVRITRHLQSASDRLSSVRLADEDRQQLAGLLQAALDRSVVALRARFGPVLTTALHDVGLQPRNPPERAAFAKMVEELLDRIITHGFLTFTDLRDTVSRNQLKLPDLKDPEDFLRGDPLIRLDRRLGSLLDGVYRTSDLYTRWLERATALNFGTATGRLVTRYFTLPFGGAFALVEGVTILLHSLGGPTVPGPLYWLLVVLLGAFLMALLQFEQFRHRCRDAVLNVYRPLRRAFVELPLRIVPWESLRRLVASWPFQMFYSYGVKPLLVCLLLLLFWPRVFGFFDPGRAGGEGTPQPLVAAVLCFVAVNALINSRIGQAVTDALFQGMVAVWDQLRAGLLPGLYRLIVRVFRQVTDALDYVLFKVDEWLRFRSGDSRTSMVVRTILGVFWFPVSFLARFYMVVLIEPGFNPIKAPVSYLAAKLMVPFLKPLTEQMVGVLAPLLGWQVLAWVIAVPTVWLLPDAFGFLFWEMKENWSVYRANRRATLRPVAVGPHGETVRGLLEPGFHSGTVPRLYARLRQAERLAYKTRNWNEARRCRHELAEVGRSLHRLVERELVGLLEQSSSWQGQGLAVGGVYLAVNRLRVDLLHAAFPGEAVEIEFELRQGWLVAGVRASGWLDRLQAEQRRALTTALASLYKLAGVELVREQVRANLPAPATAYDLTAQGLAVTGSADGLAVRYDLRDAKGEALAQVGPGEPAFGWPPLDPDRVVFARTPVYWSHWVESWQKDQEGAGHLGAVGPGVELVPAAEAPAAPGPATNGEPAEPERSGRIASQTASGF